MTSLVSQANKSNSESLKVLREYILECQVWSQENDKKTKVGSTLGLLEQLGIC